MTTKRFIAVIPGVGVSLLPKLACPMCWPAYAGLLSTVGLGFLISERYLFGLTAAFLLVSIGALAFRARERRGYGPSALGLAAAAIVLVGKFNFDSKAGIYAGLGFLIAAGLWNTWPRASSKQCLRSAPGKNELIHLNEKERCL